MRTPKIVSLMMLTLATATMAVACGDASPIEDEARGESATGLTGTSGTTVTSGGTTTKAAIALPAYGHIVVAEARTPAGAAVTFVKGVDNELGIQIIGKTGVTDTALESATKAAAGDTIKFFELLTGTLAPAALKQAVIDSSRDGSFALTSAEPESASQGPVSGVQITNPPNPSAVSSSFCDITNNAYNGSGKFEYCWPNQYSTPWVSRHEDHMSCRFDVVEGPIRVRYRYKTVSGWHTPVDVWLDDGWYMQWTGSYRYAERDRECKTVDNPSSNQHHFRVVGHDNLAAVPFNPLTVYFPAP